MGCASFLYIADAEGKIWQLNPLDGTDVGTTVPYYDAAADSNTYGCSSGSIIKCPLAILRPAFDNQGNLHLIAITGGYDWMAPGIRAQYINIDTTKALSKSNPTVIKFGGVGERAYGAPIVYGDDIYLTTSDADVNALGDYAGGSAKGHIYKISVSSGAQTELTVAGGEAGMMGSSSLAIGYGGSVIGTGAQGILKKSNTVKEGNAPLTGTSVPPNFRLWLQNFRR